MLLYLMSTPFQTWYSQKNTQKEMPLLQKEDLCFLSQKPVNSWKRRMFDILEDSFVRHHTYYYEQSWAPELAEWLSGHTNMFHPYVLLDIALEEKIYWASIHPAPQYIWILPWDVCHTLFNPETIRQGLRNFIPDWCHSIPDLPFKQEYLATWEPENAELLDKGKVPSLKALIDVMLSIDVDDEDAIEFLLLGYRHYHQGEHGYWEAMETVSELSWPELADTLACQYHKRYDDIEKTRKCCYEAAGPLLNVVVLSDEILEGAHLYL